MEKLKHKVTERHVVDNDIGKAADDTWENVVGIENESYGLLHISIILIIKTIEDRIQKGMYFLRTCVDMFASLNTWKNIAKLTDEQVKV